MRNHLKLLPSSISLHFILLQGQIDDGGIGAIESLKKLLRVCDLKERKKYFNNEKF